MTEVDPGAVSPAVQRAFARKVRFSKWALFFERLWPRLWLLIGLVALFIGLSFAGLWPTLSSLVHQGVLAAFGLAGLAVLIFMARVPWPTREEAVRRLEQRSGVAHRPATSYEDHVTAQAADPQTMRIWQAHRERLRQTIERLRVGPPSPRADRFDPFALRALALLLLIPAGLFVTGSLSDRIASAFRFAQTDAAADQRVDAWVSPPPYTAVPPVMLADGAASARQKEQQPKFYEVPEHSLLTLRGSGVGSKGLTLEILADGATPEIITSEKPASDGASDMVEVRYDLKRSARIRALSGGRELAHWTFEIIPDQLPRISLDTSKLSGTPRGSMRFSYKAEDDYGVASAQVKMRLLRSEDDGNDRNSWARAKLTGPRLPLEKPPPIALRIPQPGAKTVDTSMLLEFGEHPWAGQHIELWLEASDVGGQVGRSEPVKMVLPERRFKKPLARSLIEMRRRLTEDSRHRSWVTRALAAVTMEPEGFIPADGVYLGLRGIYYRLERSGTREAINESISELWQIALQVEDGDLSDAERALKDAQDRLSDALQKGADDAEINRLIAELKQKLNDYLQEMQKQAQQNGGPQDQDQGMDEQQQLGDNDLDQMLKDLERNAKQGAREEAEKMLSQLRELMDRLQAETPESRQANQRAKEMMNKLSALDDLADKQRQLMDETFGEQRQKRNTSRGGTQPGNQSEDNQQGGSQEGQQGQQGEPNNQGGGQRGQGQMGEGQQGQGQRGRDGQSPGQRQMSEGDLRQRQAELREQLNQLQKDLENLGAGDPDKLGRADDAMQQAEDALRDGDYGEAAEQQGEAIEQMRQTAQQMAQEMQQNAQQRLGRNGNSPRDPLGRPQRAEGPDLGTSVKVPDEIDAQRAREILDELRKRSGQNLRPPTELDYIDRLLKRF